MGLRKKDNEGEESRTVDFGRQERNPPFADNSVKTSKYSWISFFPLAIREQFRRNGNIYFACVGILMFVGYYSPWFYSSVNPWTTLGPLAVVVSVSLAQEGYTDARRHVSDKTTNNHPCVVLRRAEEIDSNDRKNKRKNRVRDLKVNKGKDVEAKVGTTVVPIAFESVNRMKILTGDIVFVRNREMIPADLILLASANEGGSAYVETSSIDGETNLKLRSSPHLPAQGPDALAASSCDSLLGNDSGAESLKHAVQRIANMSLLGHVDGVGAVLNPKNADELPNGGSLSRGKSLANNISTRVLQSVFKGRRRDGGRQQSMMAVREGENVSYVTTLTSEPPNQHVNNYTGKLTLPPQSADSRSESAPLGAENLLLRGAVLRNTEWVIGVACFTGSDTKLVMNSVATPSKFSQLDMLINRTVLLVLGIMIASVCSLGVLSTVLNQRKIGTLWYAGFSTDPNVPWPYFNLGESSNLVPPAWKATTPNYLQNTFMFITMLSNFVPLSLYVSVEMITIMMMFYVGWDLNMYHAETDTPASARSTIVTDLGLVEYIFSDKTGTLTCNVMEFKRCSVDGNVFGMPVAKASPQRALSFNEKNEEIEDEEFESARPLKRLLAAGTSAASAENVDQFESEKLTFNAEMFLRVMSICHTVVVEKDQVPDESDSNDASKEILQTESNVSTLSMLTPMKRAKAKATKTRKKEKKDGSPEGFVYQAESPDEGALVAAASNEFGFQLLGRDSSGVHISCSCPSLLEDENIVEGMKDGTLTAKVLAGKTASNEVGENDITVDECCSPRKETWTILAVNKFDSDRKRMSVLVRSPPELGSVPMLFCKGADSAMMLDGVCEGVGLLEDLATSDVESDSEVQNAEFASLLGIQAHLGEFATEGLRTLVLGVKIMTEEKTEEWLAKYKDAATSIENRDKKLTAVAYEVETGLHIVGATAIEDKLQDGVPETISKLGKAGIKLWVLTGDKRETAIEIGYSTKVLSPKMHLTEVVDGPAQKVKTLIAMELMRHIKIGNLPAYQFSSLDHSEGSILKSIMWCFSVLGVWNRRCILAWNQFYLTQVKRMWLSKDNYKFEMEDLEEQREADKRKADPRVQRRKVRQLAREIIKEFWSDPNNAHLKKADDNDETSVVSDDPPAVFERAKSARESLQSRRGRKSSVEVPSAATIKKLALCNENIFDEEALSMRSYIPTSSTSKFDNRKRTIFERLFAVDKDVRHGQLVKHLNDDYNDALALDVEDQAGKEGIEEMLGVTEPGSPAHQTHFDPKSVRRGLILEGAALKHILNDPVLEEMLFAVASCSESVIACRVSPIQKALLLKMVRKYVEPTPTTLAIGDGANDVGMIQEAHVGIGISGLEGQQAVNSSDFAIAQFRYLEDLLLIHGRWNFMRMSKAVLFFFYKNAALVSTMMLYSVKCLHSGTTLYDSWVLSVFNFVGASLPVVFMAVFDRDLSRDYVMRNPEVYQSGPRKEYMSLRTFIRWVVICVVHVFTVYYFSAPPMQLGGGVTSAYKGLMGNFSSRRVVGDGEGGGIKIFGTTIFGNLVYVVTLKALLETRSIINGEFPTITCKKGKGEGWPSRMGYTWVGVSWFSVLFYIWFLYMYQLIGRSGPSSFFPFVFVTEHLLNMRSITWVLSILAPTIAIIFDVTGKVYSNIFYPTQSQIHAEIEAQERKKNK